jgi:hypothetical protein
MDHLFNPEAFTGPEQATLSMLAEPAPRREEQSLEYRHTCGQADLFFVNDEVYKITGAHFCIWHDGQFYPIDPDYKGRPTCPGCSKWIVAQDLAVVGAPEPAVQESLD